MKPDVESGVALTRDRVCEGWLLAAAASEVRGESVDAVLVVSVGAEVLTVDVPVDAVASA
jgi:hypothetical protein